MFYKPLDFNFEKVNKVYSIVGHLTRPSSK